MLQNHKQEDRQIKTEAVKLLFNLNLGLPDAVEVVNQYHLI